MKKLCTLWTKVLSFVSGFLSVSIVGNKMAAKNLLEGRGFMANFGVTYEIT